MWCNSQIYDRGSWIFCQHATFFPAMSQVRTWQMYLSKWDNTSWSFCILKMSWLKTCHFAKSLPQQFLLIYLKPGIKKSRSNTSSFRPWHLFVVLVDISYLFMDIWFYTHVDWFIYLFMFILIYCKCFLNSILTFYLTCYSDLLVSGILFGIFSNILSGNPSWHLFWHFLWRSLSSIPAGFMLLLSSFPYCLHFPTLLTSFLSSPS